MSGSSLRILHIDTERTWRGGEQQAFSLIRGLTARGHFNLTLARKAAPFAHRLEDAGERIVRVSPCGEWDLFAAWAARRIIRAERIDVVHAHTGHAVALAALAVRGTGVPFVLTRRVDFHLNHHPFSRWKYASAARIVAISNGVKRILLEDDIPADKITVVHSGVDFSRFQDVRPALRESFGVPADAFLVGQVAALVGHKDQATFLRTAGVLVKRRPDFHAVIVGAGELEADLKHQARSLGLEDRVHFLGYRTDALSLLASFDVFCLSSNEEGLGTSILDAMALGIPVAATRAGGIPEMAEHGKTGFLADIGDADGLASAIESAARSGKAGPVAAAARQRAHDFDVTHTISSMERLYAVVHETAHRR